MKGHVATAGVLDAPDRVGSMIDRPSTSEGPGTVLGPYKLREQIGEWGMGIVYVAEQSQPVRRRAALKVIKPNSTYPRCWGINDNGEISGDWVDGANNYHGFYAVKQ